jgi:dTDP-glucose pyrophosphorylase/CBS domain-containing protein
MYDPAEAATGELEMALVAPDLPLSVGLRRLDEFGRRVIFVVDADRRLLGVLTDGDVRRWIIAGNELDRPVSEAMNSEPIVLSEGYSSAEAREVFAAHGIDCIPVLDSQQRVVSALWWVDMVESKAATISPLGIPLVVMAGGRGSRLAPYTKVLPKPLLPIGEVPIVEIIIERFVNHGCTDVYLTVNYMANLIKAYFKDVARDYEVHFIDEPEPLGTAGSLAMLKGAIESTFFVTNCDILIEADYADVLKFHRESGNRLTVVGSLKHFTIPYGVCETAAGGRLTGMSEKPSYDYLVSTGMYVMEPEVLADIPAGRLFHVTDLIDDYIRRGVNVGVYPISEKSWLDMGQFEELSEMRSRLASD